MQKITSLNIYRVGATGWAFNDDSVGLYREMFVAGAEQLIDEMVEKKLGEKTSACILYFSDTQFPDAQIRLDWEKAAYCGNIYYCKEYNAEAWLCPALLLYFKVAPKKIYAKVEAG